MKPSKNVLVQHMHRKAELARELLALDAEWPQIDTAMSAEAATGALSPGSPGFLAYARWERKLDAWRVRERRLTRAMLLKVAELESLR